MIDWASVLLNISVFGLLFDLPVAVILVREATKKPYNTALSLFALVSVGIAVLVIAYVLAAINAASGYVVSRDVAQLGFRAAAVVLGMFPPLFLIAYRRRWFR